MERIQKYNMLGICQEETCGNQYTHYITRKILGMNLVLCFCWRHAEEFENRLLLAMKEGKKIEGELKCKKI